MMTMKNCIKEFHFKIKPGTTGLGLFTKKEWKEGSIVFDWFNEGDIAPPDFRTVQVSRNSHILETSFLRYLNHNCNPNIFVNTQNRYCQALRLIPAGEELTFFYPSTEWHLSRSFRCHCQSPFCLTQIFGAKDMSRDLLRKYRLNKHIEALKDSTEDL